MNTTHARPPAARIFPRRLSTLLVGLVSLLVFSQAATAAAPGSIDTSFGVNGKVVIAIDLGGDLTDIAQDVAIQPDGKALLVGRVQFGSTDHDFAVVRLDEQGDLDSSFGNNGIATAAFDLGDEAGDSAGAVALQADGKIVVVGSAQDAQSRFVPAVARLLTDGTLDPTFDGDGKVTLLGLGDYSTALDVAIQTDGKIVLAGDRIDSGSDCMVVRLSADGSLDSQFGGDGIVEIPFDLGGTNVDGCYALKIQDDGKIVVAGVAETAAGLPQMVAARLTAGGALDAGFSGDGKTAIDFGPGSSSHGVSIALMDDGRIVIGGDANPNGTYDFAAARLLSDGAPDPSGPTMVVDFVAGGSHVDLATDVLVQDDGSIVLAGSVERPDNDIDFGIARFLPTSALDLGFGPGGTKLAHFDLGGLHRDFAHAAAVSHDGKFVVVGSVSRNLGTDFGAVRFFGDQIFTDGFESGDLSAWSAGTP